MKGIGSPRLALATPLTCSAPLGGSLNLTGFLLYICEMRDLGTVVSVMMFGSVLVWLYPTFPMF